MTHVDRERRLSIEFEQLKAWYKHPSSTRPVITDERCNDASCLKENSALHVQVLLLNSDLPDKDKERYRLAVDQLSSNNYDSDFNESEKDEVDREHCRKVNAVLKEVRMTDIRHPMSNTTRGLIALTYLVNKYCGKDLGVIVTSMETVLCVGAHSDRRAIGSIDNDTVWLANFAKHCARRFRYPFPRPKQHCTTSSVPKEVALLAMQLEDWNYNNNKNRSTPPANEECLRSDSHSPVQYYGSYTRIYSNESLEARWMFLEKMFSIFPLPNSLAKSEEGVGNIASYTVWGFKNRTTLLLSRVGYTVLNVDQHKTDPTSISQDLLKTKLLLEFYQGVERMSNADLWEQALFAPYGYTGKYNCVSKLLYKTRIVCEDGIPTIVGSVSHDIPTAINTLLPHCLFSASKDGIWLSVGLGDECVLLSLDMEINHFPDSHASLYVVRKEILMSPFLTGSECETSSPILIGGHIPNYYGRIGDKTPDKTLYTRAEVSSIRRLDRRASLLMNEDKQSLTESISGVMSDLQSKKGDIGAPIVLTKGVRKTGDTYLTFNGMKFIVNTLSVSTMMGTTLNLGPKIAFLGLTSQYTALRASSAEAATRLSHIVLALYGERGGWKWTVDVGLSRMMCEPDDSAGFRSSMQREVVCYAFGLTLGEVNAGGRHNCAYVGNTSPGRADIEIDVYIPDKARTLIRPSIADLTIEISTARIVPVEELKQPLRLNDTSIVFAGGSHNTQPEKKKKG